MDYSDRTKGVAVRIEGGRFQGEGLNAGRGKARHSVVVVDDEPVCRSFCAHVLASRNYRFQAAGDGASAIDLCLNFLPETVLTDLHLPDMSGREVMSGVREAWPEAVPPPRFIAMSGEDPAWSHTQALVARFDDWLLKPFTTEALLACLETVRSRSSPAALAAVTRSNSSEMPLADPPGLFSGTQLQSAFRAQLRTHLSELDHSISTLDWTRAGDQTHRLTGAAGLAGFSGLACLGRRLLEQLRNNPRDTELLAHAYLDFLYQAMDLQKK